MILDTGTRLGPYEVTAAIGAGGMGEVYRATDTRLGREVALKLLPSAFAADPERLARFEREARLLASLNHTNIAHLYGFETATRDDEITTVHLIAMELVEGEDLADRLKRGAIPVDEAIAIAKQIAEALEEAHEKGIVHRDLKPANVKLTPDGKVKVLDFGLAKAWAGDTAKGSTSDLSQSPTLAHTGTGLGVILGTAAYMSPEQARGKAVDKRADIWAFGVLLFEMLTGQRLFGGETVSDTLAAVLRQEVDWAALPAGTPPSLRRMLERCLARNPKARLHDIADARIVIDEVLAGRLDEGTAAPPENVGARTSRRAAWAGAIAVAAVLGVLVGRLGGPAAVPEAPMSFPLALPGGWKLSDADTPLLAISRDGRRRAVVAVDKEGRESLFLAEQGDGAWRESPKTEGARAPFFSPDGKWLGYFGERSLMRVAVDGGPPVAVPGSTGNQVRGAAWLPDGSIVYSPDAGTPLFRILESGGEPKPLTTLSARERTHRWPDALPDGSAVLFTVDSGDTTEFYDDASIEAVVVATGARKTLVREASMARYLDPGVLVFARGGTLFAVRLDPRSLEVQGTPVPVLQGVGTTVASGAVQFALSATGDLFWAPGDSSEAAGGQPVWFDRNGARGAPILSEGSYTQLDLAPDGRRLAVLRDDGGKSDAWVIDLQTHARSRVTFDGNVADPSWSPDGKRLLYVRLGAATGGGSDVYWNAADGSGGAEPLVVGPEMTFSPSLSPDGRMLIYDHTEPGGTSNDLWVMSLEGERSRRPFLATPAIEFGARISPDGRFVAYTARESGRYQVFVRAFPAGTGLWQISRQGGVEPQWARDGSALYFRDRRVLYRVAVGTGPAFAPGNPERVATGLRSGENVRSYSIAPDGNRIVALPGWEVSSATAQVNLSLRWSTEVRRRLGLDR